MTIYKFYSQSCQPCKALTMILAEYDIEVEPIDFESEDNVDICDKFGVMSVPTIVVEKEDGSFDKTIGLTSIRNKIEEGGLNG